MHPDRATNRRLLKQHCKRQWHLADQTHLRYIHLNNFDAAMHGLCLS